MAVRITQAMRAMEAGRKHWRGVVAGKVPPHWPKRYSKTTELGRWFARGAVDEMSDQIANIKRVRNNY